MAREARDTRVPATWRALTAALALCAAIVLAGWVATERADAEMELKVFTTSVSTTQAGGHPDVDYTVTWTHRGQTFDPCNCEDARTINTHFPVGFIGNPHSIPTCTLAEFGVSACPVASQIGDLEVSNFARQAIYNMEPHEGEPGLLGFIVPLVNSPAFVVLHARTGSDYGLDATSSAIYHTLALNNLEVHLWGVPADPIHDPDRFPAETTGKIQCPPYPAACLPPVPSDAVPAPYLQNPTTCGESLTASIDVDYYQGADAHGDSPWPATTGCDQLTFDPSLTALPTTTAADTASGLDVDLKVPQPQSPTVPSPSEIRAVKLTMPPGFSLVPSGANGKTDCADSQLNFETEEAAECPEFAKIGTTVIDSSALPGPIEGSAYIGQPLPGETFRLFVTGDGFATHVKLKGTVHLDQRTGQVITTFENLPQSPIQEFQLHFFGSERGIFGMPTRCGSYPVQAEFVPWDSVLPTQTSTSSFEVTSGPGGRPCPGAQRPLDPRLQAGTADNTAGAFTPFTLQLERDDGDQNLVGLTVKTPPGMLASLRGIPYCPQSAIDKLADPSYSGIAEQAVSACPVASKIGEASAAAGPGTRPVYVAGTVYLAGPYKGAPVSLLVVIPAVSGPYDLGNVAVRVAVYVDPTTTQLTAVSDPLPLVLEGVPLRTRMLQVRLDRNQFTLNPTNCAPSAVEAAVFGDEGALANLISHFQVANCADLGFSPKLSLRLTGGVNRLGHPAIHARLTAAPGESNIGRISVALPQGEQLDNSHLGTVCTRVQFAEHACPEGSQLGSVEATSPLLDQPLKGNAYLRSSQQGLPDLALDLQGQVEIVAVAKIDSVNEGLRATFKTVPDVPVSTISLNLLGGKKGLLQNSESLCGANKKATARMTGQNGMTANSKVKLQVACGGAARHRRHHDRGHRG